MSLLTPRQVAEELSVSAKTVQRMVARGELSAVKVGSSIRFHPEDVRKAMRPIKVYQPSSALNEVSSGDAA